MREVVTVLRNFPGMIVGALVAGASTELLSSQLNTSDARMKMLASILPMLVVTVFLLLYYRRRPNVEQAHPDRTFLLGMVLLALAWLIGGMLAFGTVNVLD